MIDSSYYTHAFNLPGSLNVKLFLRFSYLGKTLGKTQNQRYKMKHTEHSAPRKNQMKIHCTEKDIYRMDH